MFYFMNYISLIFFMIILWYGFKPKRYKTIRKHSRKKRDYKVFYVQNRKQFHNLLMSKSRHLIGVPDAVDIVLSRRENGRIVGAFIYMNYELLRRNKYFVKNNIIKRDSAFRKKVGAPGMSLVKDQVVDNGGMKASLYHLTHLIAFRHSLSEGDFDGLLFTGTAHLNSGSRYDINYVPAYSKTIDSTLSRVQWLKDYFFEHNEQIVLDYPKVKTGFNFGKRGDPQFSLNEFELLYDFFLSWKKDHVFKYGIECHYINGSTLVDRVNVIIIDVTDNKLLVDVILGNYL